MCGRYVLYYDIEKVGKSNLNINIPNGIKEKYTPSCNICPTDNALVVSTENPKEFNLYKFGMTPEWSKQVIINGRSESLVYKKTFQQAIRSRRCLIAANMFIEGPKQEGLNKPFKAWLRENEFFYLGGIWNEYFNKKTEQVEKQFVIITLEPNALLKELNFHRMPLVFSPNEAGKWLENRSLRDITCLIQPYPSEQMNLAQISTSIKNPRIKDISLLEPTSAPIKKEYDYIMTKKSRLEGMGQTQARRRNDQ